MWLKVQPHICLQCQRISEFTAEKEEEKTSFELEETFIQRCIVSMNKNIVVKCGSLEKEAKQQ